MKPHAAASLQWGKEVYSGLHIESEKTLKAEAFALGCDQSTVCNYVDPETDRHLPYGLVPNSLYAKELTEALCAKLGGVFVHLSGHPNGQTTDEFAAILRACSDLAKESDPAKRRKLFLTIGKKAEFAAREEETK